MPASDGRPPAGSPPQDTATDHPVPLAVVADRREAADPRGRCLDDERIRLDNAGFAGRIRAAAAVLAGHDLGRGDVLAIMLPNRVELLVAMLAAWRLGATVTPLNPKLTAEEARHQLEDSGATVAVVDDQTAARVAPVVERLVAVDRLGDPLPPGSVRDAVAQPDDLALLIYTSGTTARPKGVMLTHANLTAMLDSWSTWAAISPADRALLVLPLFHVNAIVASALGPLLAGASTVIGPRFDAASFWRDVERERPSYVSVVPTIVNALAALPADVRPDTSSLRFVACGAAPVSGALLEGFEARYGAPVVEGYGLSECTLAAAINPLDGPRKVGTVGPALPGTELRIVGPDGQTRGAGEEGEVAIRGPHVMRGYLGLVDETARTLRDGWLYSGDLGSLDADGYLSITGRSKDLIIRGGENIAPKEIEEVLGSHPAVLEVAVVGAPDPHFGEQVVAFVGLRDGATTTERELLDFCAAGGLAPFKRPREVLFVDALPKNPVGKIVKGPLRERLAARDGERGGATGDGQPGAGRPSADDDHGAPSAEQPGGYVNPDARTVLPEPADATPGAARRFHESIPGYAPSRLVEAPPLAAELGLAGLYVKDESARLELPSFKVLGASWAVARALRQRPGLEHAGSFDDLRRALATESDLTLTCATDGNHGRAVAALARRLGLRARIFVPDAVSSARARAIEGEGAEVVVLPVDYDEAVRTAAATADERTLVVSDTSWAGYEQIPGWVLDGYATIFEEVDERLARLGLAGPDVVVVQMGVGAFAAAVVAHFKRHDRPTPARILGVEPHDAACVLASLRAGGLTTVDGPHGSTMDGLNCGTPSPVAWPALRAGLDAVVTVGDGETHAAMRDLAACGVEAGESGAAGLAGLRAATGAPESLRVALGLDRPARVLVFNTEGATDPVRYRAVVGTAGGAR